MSVEANNSTAEAGCFLSVRSSCDRCRVQKLKCSVLSGSGACERCTRAKLPCVFGRRTRNKRSSSSSNVEGRPARLPVTPNTSPVTQAVPLTPFTSSSSSTTTTTTPPNTTPASSTTTAAALATAAPSVKIMVPPTMTTVSQGDYLLTPPGPYLHLAGPVDSIVAGPDTESGCHYMRSCDNSNNVVMLHDSFTDVLESDSDLGNHSWSQFGFDVADVTMFDGSQMNLPRWSSSSSLSSSSHQLGSVTASSLPSMAAAHSKVAAGGHGLCNAVVLTSQRLITLISEIQQRLKKLEDSPWHAGSARSLDDYPVGSVLQLSQQFSSIAGLALSTGRITGGMVGATGVMMDEDDSRALTMEVASSSEDGRANKDSDADGRKANDGGPTTTTVLDTATILLLLSGYMWLVRMFDMALSHFQNHLNRMPNRYDHDHDHHDGLNASSSNSSSNSSSHTAATATAAAAVAGRTLRLGELQWANGALDLQKIHIAVSMLLDALHDVEGHMGRGGGAVRDMAVTLLLNDPTRRGDGAGFGGSGWHYAGGGLGLGLGKRVVVVKELLREKMGL